MQMNETPLSRAAHNGHLQMVKYLVEQGSDVNCLDLVNNFIPKEFIQACTPLPHAYVSGVFMDVSCIDDATHDLHSCENSTYCAVASTTPSHQASDTHCLL